MNEHQYRIRDLRMGPWLSQAQLAITALPAIAEEARAKSLVPHWEKTISRQSDIDLRESLDQWLEYLQLLELAVQSGYLPLASVRREARPHLTALSGSPAVSRYLVAYDFVGVRLLASRFAVAFPGLPPLAAPPPAPLSEVRFATVLSSHAVFTADDSIEVFTRLLDDYYFDDFGVANFRAYLKAGKSAFQKLPEGLADGCLRFTIGLGETFSQLECEERRFYGTLYAYWLGKFFDSTSGVASRLPSRALFPAGLPEDVVAMETSRVEDSLTVLRSVYQAILKLTENDG